MQLVIVSDRLDAELDALIGQSGLLVSGWLEGPWPGGPPTNVFTLRDASGALIFLSSYATINAVGQPYQTEAIVGSAFWLTPGSPEYAEWNAPFGDIWVRDLGCAERASARYDLVTEIPWAIELEADAGLETMYDQSIPDVDIEGVPYRAFVSTAVEVGERVDGEPSDATYVTLFFARVTR